MHFLIKSTIKPGTTEKLQAKYPKRTFTFSPEYIGEGKYEIPFWKDMPHPTNMKMHSFHIFGGPRAATKLWIELWQKVAGWIASYHQTNSRTAELCKYAENMYLATKKLFCSELYLTATAMGVDYHELKELWLLDGRIGRSMTLVWPDKLAFDGKCLPKDTAALVQASTEAGHDPKLFRSVIERNAQLAQPVVSKKTR
jgi:UDPglucose 6-dehydrogenase